MKSSRLLDYPSYFELLDRPMLESTEGVLESLESERLISRDVGGKWNIHNLGAILLANDMGEFESRLARKAMRFVVYDGQRACGDGNAPDGFSARLRQRSRPAQ